MGRGSFGYLVAQLAIRTGISPHHLLELDRALFNNLIQVLNDDAKDAEDGRRGKRR